MAKRRPIGKLIASWRYLVFIFVFLSPRGLQACGWAALVSASSRLSTSLQPYFSSYASSCFASTIPACDQEYR